MRLAYFLSLREQVEQKRLPSSTGTVLVDNVGISGREDLCVNAIRLKYIIWWNYGISDGNPLGLCAAPKEHKITKRDRKCFKMEA